MERRPRATVYWWYTPVTRLLVNPSSGIQGTEVAGVAPRLTFARPAVSPNTGSADPRGTGRRAGCAESRIARRDQSLRPDLVNARFQPQQVHAALAGVYGDARKINLPRPEPRNGGRTYIRLISPYSAPTSRTPPHPAGTLVDAGDEERHAFAQQLVHAEPVPALLRVQRREKRIQLPNEPRGVRRCPAVLRQ